MATKATIDPESFDMIVVRDFLQAHWNAWAEFAQERDADPDEIFENIGGEPDSED